MVERLRNAIRDVEGFPKEGIVFKDITPILGDGALFRGSIDPPGFDVPQSASAQT